MAGRGFAERQAQETFEGQAVVNLVFQLGIGGNAKPFLQQQTFEQEDGWVGAGAFIAGETFEKPPTFPIFLLREIFFRRIQRIRPKI
jgi:hypothetical protein